MVSRRQERVSELLREELSILIGDLTDPRLADSLVSVSDVAVSPDLRSARVFVQHVLPPASSRQVLSALKHAESFLRQALTENLSLRFVPELHFQIDTTEDRARRIDALLDTIAAAAQTPDQPAKDSQGGAHQ